MDNVDAVIIGAGHNGLVTAAYLGRAGKRVLLLERRSAAGGIVATEEVFPGFTYSPCAQLVGGFSRAIFSELGLARNGLEILPFPNPLFVPGTAGNALMISREPAETAKFIGALSARDGEKFGEFCGLMKKLSSFLNAIYDLPLPDRLSAGGSNSQLLRLGWKFHRLGRKHMQQLLRILPMSIADLLDEWFESELLKAGLAGGALLGSFVGPRQQGTAYAYLHHQIGASNGAVQTAGFVKGGAGNLAQALARAAVRNGAEIRTDAEVTKIVTRHGAATGVVLRDGQEIAAEVVISNADPKHTFLKLLEPTYLDPLFLLQVKNIRSRGTAAKVNFALGGLPEFVPAAAAARLSGIIRIGPTLDYLERAADDAKYGRYSTQPFLEITLPSIADPGSAPSGRHVMSVWMQSAPYHLRNSRWQDQRDTIADIVADTIETYAPGFKNLILHRHVMTPVDLEEHFGLTGGHLYHAELTLDQIFFMRPVPGWAAHRTPIRNLYLCGSGTHPGGGITGLPGYHAARTILKSRR